MPGITVTTAVRTGPGGASDSKISQLFLAGTSERGSVTAPTLVRSLAEFETYYGTYISGGLTPHVRTYFEEGGTRAYVMRVLASDAVAATHTFQDSGAGSSLIVTAANPGVWGNNISMSVETVATNFVLKFYLSGVLIYSSAEFATVTDAIAAVNASSISHLVVLSDGGSGLDPDAIAATALSSGVNGTAVAAADYTTALTFFGYDLGPGAVAMPGQTGNTAWNDLVAHGVNNNRIAILGFGAAQTVAGAVAAAAGLSLTGDATGHAEYAEFAYPWVTVPDPAASGSTINISPEAYVAAARSKAASRVGPWAAGAGIISESAYILGTDVAVSAVDSNTLDDARINAIRKIGSRYRVYGARSASTDDANWRFITYRDTVNHIVWEAEQRLEEFLFEPIDSRNSLFRRIEASLVGMLDPIRTAGGLYEAYDTEGNKIDPGYSVEVSATNNPISELATGKVTAAAAVRVSSVGDKINVTITKASLTASVI